MPAHDQRFPVLYLFLTIQNFLLKLIILHSRQNPALEASVLHRISWELLGTGEFNVGDKPAMDKHPIQGEETGISYGIDGLLGLYAAFNLPLVKSSGCNIFISNQQIFNHGCDM